MGMCALIASFLFLYFWPLWQFSQTWNMAFHLWLCPFPSTTPHPSRSTTSLVSALWLTSHAQNQHNHIYIRPSRANLLVEKRKIGRGEDNEICRKASWSRKGGYEKKQGAGAVDIGQWMVIHETSISIYIYIHGRCPKVNWKRDDHLHFVIITFLIIIILLYYIKTL